jgi:hypothetical protein
MEHRLAHAAGGTTVRASGTVPPSGRLRHDDIDVDDCTLRAASSSQPRISSWQESARRAAAASAIGSVAKLPLLSRVRPALT